MDAESGIDSGDSGSVFRKRQACLYDYSDDCLPAGGGVEEVRRVKKVGNFHIFESDISRDAAQRRMVYDLLALI